MTGVLLATIVVLAFLVAAAVAVAFRHRPGRHPTPSGGSPPSYSGEGGCRLLVGQNLLAGPIAYVAQVDPSGRSLWGGSCYWFLCDANMGGEACMFSQAGDNCCQGPDCGAWRQEQGCAPPPGPSFDICSYYDHAPGASAAGGAPGGCVRGRATTGRYLAFLDANTAKYGNYVEVAVDLKGDYPHKPTTPGPDRIRFLTRIAEGGYDANLVAMNRLVGEALRLTFLVRIGYEVQLSYFVRGVADPNAPNQWGGQGRDTAEDWRAGNELFKKAYRRIAAVLRGHAPAAPPISGALAPLLRDNRSRVQTIFHFGSEAIQNNDKGPIFDAFRFKWGVGEYHHPQVLHYSWLEWVLGDPAFAAEVDYVGVSLMANAFINGALAGDCTPVLAANGACLGPGGQDPGGPPPAICAKLGANKNCVARIFDDNQRVILEVAKAHFPHKPVVICESTMDSDWHACCRSSPEVWSLFLEGMAAMIARYRVAWWAFICVSGWYKGAAPFWEVPGVKNTWRTKVLPLLERRPQPR